MIGTLALAILLLPQEIVPVLAHGPQRRAWDSTRMDFWARNSPRGECALEQLRSTTISSGHRRRDFEA